MEIHMKRKLILLVMIAAVLVTQASYHTTKARATAAGGFVATTLAKGTLAQFEVFNHSILPQETNGRHEREDHDRNVWLSLQKTKGSSDLYVQSNVWQPGGSTGWHSHPGHSLITVTAGTITDYEGDDPECKPHVYTVGSSFVDHGGDHVHIIRNEGTEVAQTIAVQLIPAGAVRRIDVADPNNCHF
jgi:quercetin dioxygenase-like cupin family protein